MMAEVFCPDCNNVTEEITSDSNPREFVIPRAHRRGARPERREHQHPMRTSNLLRRSA